MTEPESNLLENLQTQLEELESLQAMFYNPGEIKIEDIGMYHDIKDYVSGKMKLVPPCLDFTVNLLIDDNKFEMCVSLGHEYPFVEPEVFVRNCRMNRVQHAELNKKIGDYLKSLPKGEPCIFTAISWLQDNAHSFIDLEKEGTSTEINRSEQDDELVRYWIYSHHIYSKTKRKSITDLAHQLKVNGFIMPGKPGIICVEGGACDVNEWWQSVKSMNWKKIFCKITESTKEDAQQDNFLKFKDFMEIVFESHGPKFNHMDMGEFSKYLEQKDLGYIFKDLFGVEARNG
ncbi:RWD domain-containing protein 2A [Anthonomus grandis grandis]|uniref:RWD domain-containing protein 2A n=1 Tax=Anthonomus grandis grandis TaxID=2921223 RepID=UPI00216505CF|nr:RWD domain-containing protein 2A [Anthonomus grandis grandis]